MILVHIVIYQQYRLFYHSNPEEPIHVFHYNDDLFVDNFKFGLVNHEKPKNKNYYHYENNFQIPDRNLVEEK